MSKRKKKIETMTTGKKQSLHSVASGNSVYTEDLLHRTSSPTEQGPRMQSYHAGGRPTPRYLPAKTCIRTFTQRYS